MNQTIEALEQTADEAEAAAAEAETGTSSSDNTIVNFITSIPENVTNAASGVSEEVQARLNMFIETLAVMIVTSCVIPILVLLFFLWLAKTILGVHIDVPASSMMPRSMRRLRK